MVQATRARHIKSLNARAPAVNVAQNKAIREEINEAIEKYKEQQAKHLREEQIRLANLNKQDDGSTSARSTNGWKKKLDKDNDDPEFDISEHKWIWNDGLTAKFLPQEKIEKLNEHMHLVKYLPTDEQQFKYLQLNLIVDAIEDYIKEISGNALGLN